MIIGKRPLQAGYALLPDKEARSYNKLVEVILTTVNAESMIVTKLMCDYEHNMWKAFQRRLSKIMISGCTFHQRKAIRHKLGDLGLIVLYGTSTTFNYLIKLVYGLAFVPIEQVPVVIKKIVEPHAKKLELKDFYAEYEVSNNLKFLNRITVSLLHLHKTLD